MSVSPSIVLTCGADVCSSGKHLFTSLEVRIDVLKRWRPAPFLGKFPFFNIPKKKLFFLGCPSVGDIKVEEA